MIEIDYQSGGIVSKQLLKTPTGNITLFAFDRGQGLTEHTSPFHALITVLEGVAEVSIAGTQYTVKAGELIELPANVPHGVQAAGRFKMTLTMLKT